MVDLPVRGLEGQVWLRVSELEQNGQWLNLSPIVTAAAVSGGVDGPTVATVTFIGAATGEPLIGDGPEE